MRLFIIILCFCLTSCVSMNQPFDTIRVSLEEVHNISNQNISSVSEQIVSLQQDSVVMKPVAEVTPVA